MLWWLSFSHSLNIFLMSAYIFFSKLSFWPLQGLPRWLSTKESTCQGRRHRRLGFDPWVGKMPWHRKWQATPTLLPGKSYGWRSLVSYSLGRGKKSDTPEQQRVCTHCVGGPVHPFLMVLFIPSSVGYSGQWIIQLLGAHIEENSQTWWAPGVCATRLDRKTFEHTCFLNPAWHWPPALISFFSYQWGLW